MVRFSSAIERRIIAQDGAKKLAFLSENAPNLLDANAAGGDDGAQ
jgi:hypothetical protein